MIHNEVCKRHKVYQIYFANARARMTNKCTLQISTYLGMMSHKVSSSCVLPLLNAAGFRDLFSACLNFPDVLTGGENFCVMIQSTVVL